MLNRGIFAYKCLCHIVLITSNVISQVFKKVMLYCLIRLFRAFSMSFICIKFKVIISFDSIGVT
jgi:hypothetical protein